MRKRKRFERKVRSIVLKTPIGKFKNLILLIALCLSSVAAFFSVYGISHLFSASRLAAIIMMGFLEASKLVTISIYYRYHKKLNKKIKSYLLSSVVILILITSLGIYSYLSNAYQSTSNKLEVNSKIELLKRKEIDSIDKNIGNLREQIGLLDKRFSMLSDLRVTLETRLDGAYKVYNRKTIKDTQNSIESNKFDLDGIDDDRKKLNKELLKYIEIKNNIEREILELNLNSTNVDIGPLKYLSRLFQSDINKIVNILILVLIFTFDPLAIMLLLVYNIIIMDEYKSVIKVKSKRKRRKRKPKMRKLI